MEEVEYCGDPSKVRLLTGVVPALRQLKTRGFRLVIVTNQSGIGRRYFTERDYEAVQSELFRQMDDPGLIDASYHCPDAPNQATDRRKPGTGMIDEAAVDLELDLPSSYIIGDTCNDILCGQRAGLAGAVLVLTGHSIRPPSDCEPDYTADDLATAAVWIMGHQPRERGHPARIWSAPGARVSDPQQGGSPWTDPTKPEAGRRPALPGRMPRSQTDADGAPQQTSPRHG